MKIKTLIYRWFKVNEEDQALINLHLVQRRKVAMILRDGYAIPGDPFQQNRKMLIVWGILVAFMDNPGALLLAIIFPVLTVLIFLFDKLFGS